MTPDKPPGRTRWSRIRRRLRPGIDRPIYTSIVTAIGFALIIGLVSARQLSETRGWPRETAEVVAIEDPGGSADACDRAGSRREKDLIWRSDDPPPGLPATFTDPGSCLVTSVGRSSTVVRVVDNDGRVEVFVDPTASYADVARNTAFTAGFVFVAPFLVLLIPWAWRKHRSRRRA